MLRFLRFGAALVVAAFFATSASAQFATAPGSSSSPSFGGGALVLDDGTAENNIGLTAGGSFVWFNRFTPPAGDFPLGLNSVDVFFDTAGGCLVGDAMDIYVWSDADGDPSNGATFEGSITGASVGTLDAFNTYTFGAQLVISGPGDVLIGVVNRGCAAAGQFPAAIDQSSSAMRSWVGFGPEVDTNPPTLPTTTFDIIDNFGLAGNWMIRGDYTASVPVELTAFGATTNGSTATLTWETASETNNAGFEVQMRTDGDWDVLAFVDGNGTTTEAQTYSHTVAGLSVGTHAFRLKQIDFDGAFEYSAEVEATIEVVGTHLLSDVYPNPFNPQATFNFTAAQSQTVTATLYNALGQRVATLFDGTVEANVQQNVQIDGAALASGIYVVRVNGERFTDALRVTLLK